MKIWIMRHGEAGFNAASDSQRTLTEHGRNTALNQGQWLGKRFINQQVKLDKILVSPYQRTQQTLEQVLQGLTAVGFMQSFANLVESWDGITPMGEAQNVYDYLDFLRDEGAKNVLIISHLPLVFDLVQTFTAHQASVHFYPATLAELEWTGNVAQLITAQRAEL